MKKKLYRSSRHKIIGGVCAGIAEYIGVDVTVIRMVWLFMAAVTNIFGGMFVILYLAAWLIIPMGPGNEEGETRPEKNNKNAAVLIGGGLIIYGIIKLMQYIFDKLDIEIMPFGIMPSKFVWPLTLIAVGIFLIIILGRKDK